MSKKIPLCRECKWCWVREGGDHDICQNPATEYSNPAYEREDGKFCGPKGKLWEKANV